MVKCGLLTGWLIASIISRESHRQPPAHIDPPLPFVRFNIRTDNTPRATIAGVVLPARGRPRGTLFLCHGYGRSKETYYGWEWIRRELRWNLVLFDFREHGQSTHSPHLCTLGYHEIWDVKAVVDFAQERGLEGPYAIYGGSLGASIGLRWAARDPRIAGVLAVSPYRNGLVATRQFLRASTGWDLQPFNVHPGFRRILSVVDLPTDLSSRTDLQIWIMCGQHDIFPESDQRAILAGSPAPASMKRLFVIPGGGHNNLWSWRGDARVPSHDQIIRDFLRECLRDER
jgi:pimeloyl-ACP methyl ester carboxylesterase